MAEQIATVTPDENEFLNSWFPDIISKSYIIPAKHLDHIHSVPEMIANQPVSVLVNLRDKGTNRHRASFRINDLDVIHAKIYRCISQINEKISPREVMVMMTQASFSKYGNIFAAMSIAEIPTTSYLKKDIIAHIIERKEKHSDLIIINKQRGVLFGMVEDIHINDAKLADEKLRDCIQILTEGADIIKDIVLSVPGGRNVPIRKTFIVPNITRREIEPLVQEVEPEVTCLCKDEMDTDEGLVVWWQACWSPGQRDVMNNDLYRHLVAKFAIPATRVEIYLTTQPRLQLKHEHDVVNAVGDVHGAKVFQAGLYQLSLFPTQAALLDFDSLDETLDDFTFLWGPPGTGKTIILLLRALQWVEHFSAMNIFILQTTNTGTAASLSIEHQLQETIKAQKQHQCIFTRIDLSRLWKENFIYPEHRYEVNLTTGWKEKLYTELGLQQRGESDTTVHIVADEANGDVIAVVYDWLKELGVSSIRLWAAGAEAFLNNDYIPAILQPAVRHVTEPLRCPGPVVHEVKSARQIRSRYVPQYQMDWHLTIEPKVKKLYHRWGREGHAEIDFPWRCVECAEEILSTLKSLHVGEPNAGLSENDVFILGSCIYCDLSDTDDWSPAPLLTVLRKNYKVRTISSKSSTDDIMKVVKSDEDPPVIIVAHENSVLGLERKIIVYCDGGAGAVHRGRLCGFSRATSLLIYVTLDYSSLEKKRQRRYSSSTCTSSD